VQELIDHSSEAQLSIELASECLSLAPWDNTPAATLLDRLTRSRKAWQTLEPTRNETQSLRGDIYLTYEVCGHMFAQGKPSQTGPQPMDDDPFGTRMLEFWEMPVGGIAVEGDNNQGWYRKYEDMGMDIVDFTFDPSQDALFFVEKQEFVNLFFPLLDSLYNSLPKVKVRFPPADALRQPAPSGRQNGRHGNRGPLTTRPM